MSEHGEGAQPTEVHFQAPQLPEGARGEQLFEIVTWHGIETALSIIDRDIGDRLPYHGLTHTKGVVARTERILAAIQASDMDGSLVTSRIVALGKFAAGWHDVVQKREADGARGPDNEQQSANLATTYMRSMNEQLGNIFTDVEVMSVHDAIMLTVPTFDTDRGTVVQPQFAEHHDNIIAQALALADLGGGGMEGADTERWETDALFSEDNPDFIAYKHAIDEDPSMKDSVKEEVYKEKMMSWLASQSRFIRGRQQQVEEDIGSMDPLAQEPVRQLFHKYDESVSEIHDMVSRRKPMKFDSLVADVDHVLNNPPQYQVSG